MEAGPTKTNRLRSLLPCARPLLEKKHINEWFILFDFQTIRVMQKQANHPSLLVWPIGSWGKRGMGSLVLAKRGGG